MIIIKVRNGKPVEQHGSASNGLFYGGRRTAVLFYGLSLFRWLKMIDFFNTYTSGLPSDELYSPQ
jgi:hypothetical protein